MPQYTVVYPRDFASPSAPQFLVVAAGTMDDPHYTLWRVLPHGTIFMHK